MPFLTNEDIAQRKAAGVKMNKLNCGWNLPTEITARIAAMDSPKFFFQLYWIA